MTVTPTLPRNPERKASCTSGVPLLRPSDRARPRSAPGAGARQTQAGACLGHGDLGLALHCALTDMAEANEEGGGRRVLSWELAAPGTSPGSAHPNLMQEVG